MTSDYKSKIKRRLAESLSQASEVRKVVIFGSFLTSDTPNDIDVAVFVETDESYLPLAMKYRRMTDEVTEELPMDIIPVRPDASGFFFEEINRGEVIYAR